MKKQLPCLSFRKALLAFEEIVIVDLVIIEHRFARLAGLQPIPGTLRGPHPSFQIVASQSHHHMNFAPAKIDDVGWDQRLPDLLDEVHTIHWWVQDFHRVKTVLKLLLGNLHSFFNTVHFGQDIVHHVSSCQFISHPPWVPRALRPCFLHVDPRHKSCILSWPSAWLRTSSWSAPSCSQGPSHGQWGSYPWQSEQVSAPPWS